jgi:hypothetical protein
VTSAAAEVQPEPPHRNRAGIRVVATGDRTLLTGKLAALAEDKVVLRMAGRKSAVDASRPTRRDITFASVLVTAASTSEKSQGGERFQPPETDTTRSGLAVLERSNLALLPARCSLKQRLCRGR